MSFSFVKRMLAERAEKSLLRKRKIVTDTRDGIITIDSKACLNFGSNDYLGLSQHPDVLQAFAEGLAQYGAGGTASPLICGHTRAHQALEDALCERLNKSSALLFNSGFAANQALCQALFSAAGGKRNEHSSEYKHIICDKLMHASFLEGAMHTSARLQRFSHNDVSSLALRLQKTSGDVLVATEGVFSMDGDQAPIRQIHNEVNKFTTTSSSAQAQLMVDDAHSLGVIGEQGLGTMGLKDVHPEHIHILMATFGKALGTAGAFIAGDASLTEYLVNFAKHYIYSTAMPPAQAIATLKSLDIMQKGKEREQLQANIDTFKILAKRHGLPLLPSDTAIQPLLVGSSDDVTAASNKLLDLGLFVPAIRPPTVPSQQARLRITLSALHTSKDLVALVDALCIVCTKHGT